MACWFCFAHKSRKSLAPTVVAQGSCGRVTADAVTGAVSFTSRSVAVLPPFGACKQVRDLWFEETLGAAGSVPGETTVCGPGFRSPATQHLGKPLYFMTSVGSR